MAYEEVKKIPDYLVTQTEFAKLAGQTQSGISRAVRYQRIPEDRIKIFYQGKRKMKLIDKRYLAEYLAKCKSGANSGPPDLGPVNTEIQLTKLAKEKLAVERHELENKRVRNELIETEKIERVLHDLAIQIRQSILAVVPRLGPALAPEMSVHEASAILTRELSSALRALRDTKDAVLKNE